MKWMAGGSFRARMLWNPRLMVHDTFPGSPTVRCKRWTANDESESDHGGGCGRSRNYGGTRCSGLQVLANLPSLVPVTPLPLLRALSRPRAPSVAQSGPPRSPTAGHLDLLHSPASLRHRLGSADAQRLTPEIPLDAGRPHYTSLAKRRQSRPSTGALGCAEQHGYPP